MEFQLPNYNLWIMFPEIFLFVWALVVITYDISTKRQSGTAVGYLAMAGPVLAMLLALVLRTANLYDFGINSVGFGEMFVNDTLAAFFKIIFLGAAFMAIGSSFGITQQKIVNHRGEYYGLILMSTVGMMFMASSRELLSLYVGLELTTIPLFVLAAFFKDNKLSVEAGMKYFVIGAFSSALLLYGISFLYGLSGGRTEVLIISYTLGAKFLSSGSTGILMLVAILLMLAGVGFKLALPPFQQWAPDVYEGSPTPIAAFLSVGSKAAGLAAFARIFVQGLRAYYGQEFAPINWGILVSVIAILGLIIGNMLAIRQTNIKRMLAYSSIAQAGYIMIGMLAMNQYGLPSVAYYIFAYMFANMGAFAIVAAFEDKTGSCQIQSYRGLSKTSPLAAAAMAIFLLSLAGIPPMAGFLAKYQVFAAAISKATADSSASWLYWLVGTGLITSVFALFYYANVVKQMYFSKEESPYELKMTPPVATVVMVGVVGLILFGIFPESVLQFASGIAANFGFMVH